MGKSHIEFYNGQKMPIVGLGTWQAQNREELETAVDEALKAGYRHFDTAFNYLNEEYIGNVLKKWIDSGKVKREELFIVTKLPMIGMRPERVQEFLKKSLTALQLSYVDLYLIHAPIGFQYVNDKDVFPMKDGKVLLDPSTNLEEIWKAMEKQVDAGLTKAIGISNFNEKQIERIVKVAKIKPANTQVELHLFNQQKSLRKLCSKLGITVCAYSPLGSPGRAELYKQRGIPLDRIPSILNDPTVVKIATAHGKTSGQVLLRFLAQLDIVVIPKSVNPERLKQNLNIFDFELSPAEMKELENLDKEERSFSIKSFPGAELHPECPELSS